MINKILEKEIREYCELNHLNYKNFINEMIKKQFLIEKYGNMPFSNNKINKKTYIDNKISNIIIKDEITESSNTDDNKSIIFNEPKKDKKDIENKPSNKKIKIIRK